MSTTKTNGGNILPVLGAVGWGIVGGNFGGSGVAIGLVWGLLTGAGTVYVGDPEDLPRNLLASGRLSL